jgi:hypothetical protein
MGLKVAIIGLSPASHDMAPWADPEWEKWGMPWDEGYWLQCTRLFEMHDMRLLRSNHSRRKAGYMRRLQDMDCPLYMQEAYYASATRYPFEEVAKSIGGAYWNSSPAYMLALAIHEGAEEIGIYGVDLVDVDEYGYQKPNMEYLIGLARGKGIKVTIPDESALCKFEPHGIKFFDHVPQYIDRYGWLG